MLRIFNWTNIQFFYNISKPIDRTNNNNANASGILIIYRVLIAMGQHVTDKVHVFMQTIWTLAVWKWSIYPAWRRPSEVCQMIAEIHPFGYLPPSSRSIQIHHLTTC